MRLPKTLKLVWQSVILVRPDEWRRLGRWLVWCMLLAAAINAPFAVSRVETLRHLPASWGSMRIGEDMPKRWPAATPHARQWPNPSSWDEWRGFGKRLLDVGWRNPDSQKNRFSMRVRWSGWPLPVLEQKQMWWDWSDLALAGPTSDPAMRLMPAGLILNPIIIGGGLYVLLISTFLAFVIGRRYERMRRGLCLNCGYDVGGLQTCPECGHEVSQAEEH